MRKAAAIVLCVLVVITVAWWMLRVRRSATITPGAPASVSTLRPGEERTTNSGRRRIADLRTQIAADAISPIANDLNAPGGLPQRDLQILSAVFEAWQTNFPGRGNPVGENDEITAALAGDNALKFAFVSPRNPAINAAGELCDRWGTPYRLHQLSGTVMEIWSAGPDRRFGTADDLRLTPPVAATIPR